MNNIACPNCGHCFDYDEWIRNCDAEAVIVVATPNTLTNYKDISKPQVRCPKCRQIMWDRDFEPTPFNFE